MESVHEYNSQHPEAQIQFNATIKNINPGYKMITKPTGLKLPKNFY